MDIIRPSRQKVPVVCKTCSKQWGMRADFVRHWSGLCHACACREVRRRNPIPKRVSSYWRQGPPTAPCKDCGKAVTFPHPGVIRRWGGRCKECAMKEVANRPERREALRIANVRRGRDGTKTPLNQKVRQSAEYRAWRTAVFTRDNYTCMLCGKRGGTMNADHIKAFAAHPELRLDVANGRTLCVPCHHRTPTFGRPKK